MIIHNILFYLTYPSYSQMAEKEREYKMRTTILHLEKVFDLVFSHRVCEDIPKNLKHSYFLYFLRLLLTYRSCSIITYGMWYVMANYIHTNSSFFLATFYLVIHVKQILKLNSQSVHKLDSKIWWEYFWKTPTVHVPSFHSKSKEEDILMAKPKEHFCINFREKRLTELERQAKYTNIYRIIWSQRQI